MDNKKFNEFLSEEFNKNIFSYINIFLLNKKEQDIIIEKIKSSDDIKNKLYYMFHSDVEPKIAKLEGGNIYYRFSECKP